MTYAVRKADDAGRAPARRSRYVPPSQWNAVSFQTLLQDSGRAALQPKQLDLLRAADNSVRLLYAGDLNLVSQPAVSIVGTRDVSPEGDARARRLARELVAAEVVVMSGLAAGVDSAAHESAIAAGGRTIAVIGTPLDKAYPAANAELQEAIYRDHLLISPFDFGEQVYKGNFPKRNRIMAALSDATVIVEASDTSGTLHQAAECQRLGRWLFIARSVAEDPALTWPAKFIGGPKTAVLSSVEDLLAVISHGRS